MLVDFVAVFMPTIHIAARVSSVSLRLWQVYMDGASNAQGAGVDIVLVSPKGIRLEHSLRLSFRASNNEAEYEALIAGLRAVKEPDAQVVEIFFSDSHLVVSQVEESFEARDPWMAKYLKLLGMLLADFRSVKVS